MNTREHILNVSFRLFLKKNFKEVTMKEIVEKTGLSKGAFYHYFESKEQLFHEVINHLLTSITEVYNKLSKDSLYQFYHDYFNYYQQMSSMFTVEDNPEDDGGFDINIFSLLIDGIKLFPDFQDSLQDCLQTEFNAWTEAVQNSRAAGVIKSLMSDEHIANLFIYSSDGIGMHSIVMKHDSEGAKKMLIDLWDRFYEDLKR